MSKESAPTPLQALERIGNAETKDTSFGTEIKTNLSNEYHIIETALKALEIIKEKILDMNYFNIIADKCDLTYQEYELLRKVLK